MPGWQLGCARLALFSNPPQVQKTHGLSDHNRVLRPRSDSRGLLIRHEPHPYEDGYVREIRLGRVTYMVPIFIRRDAPGKTIIRDCTLHAPWDDFVEFLEEDTEKNAGWYTFSEDTYPRKHEWC